MQTPNTLNITVGTDVILNVTLEHDGVVLNPALIDNLQANLITGLGRKTPLETSTGIGYIVVNIPWVDGRLPGCYSLEITGSINDLAWSAVGKSIIRYTSATEIGHSTVEVDGDHYDVTMEVGYYYTDSPIEGVNVTVDNGVGTPSAIPSYIHKELKIDFHNLRGNGIAYIEQTTTSTEDHGVNVVTITDDLDNATNVEIRNGGTGPQGKQGIPGESAVFDPTTGNVSVLVQTTGDSITNPMSQKAVTDNISFYELVDLSAPPLLEINQVINSSNPGKWTNVSTYYRALFLPVSAGESYRITPNPNGDAIVAFLTDTSHTAQQTAHFVNGVTERSTYSEPTIIKAPNDAAYLYIYKADSQGVSKLPTVEKVVLVKDRLIEAEGEIADIKTEILSIEDSLIVKAKMTLPASTGGLINSSDKWAGVSNNKWKHSIVDITPGCRYIVESELQSSMAVLRSYTTPVDGGSPDFSTAAGFTSRIMLDDSNDKKVDFVAPSDADKLYVCTVRVDNVGSSEVISPTKATVSEVTTVSKAIEEGIGGDAKQVKMLVIGDSWGRDIATELQPAAADMGLNLYVAQAYQGGSGLYNQFKGMDDAARHYTHGTGSSAYEQYVQGTYQLWTYDGSDSPTLVPAKSSYNNGKCGINDGIAWGKVSVGGAWAAKTLAEILASQDWDIILVRLHCGELQVEDSLMADEEDEDKKYFDINDFIDRMGEELTQSCKEKVKWGLAATWSYPVEAYNISRDKIKSMLVAMGLYDSWNSMSDVEKQDVFNELYDTMQTNFQKVCKHLGDRLTYAANIAMAIQNGRNSEWLKDVAWHMNRSSDDMHLGAGIPKYICALTILYSIFDKGRNAIKFSYIPDLKDESNNNSDGGGESHPTTPTKALCVGAQAVSWQAACNTI